MKKIFILFLIFIVLTTVYAQDGDTNSEITVNIGVGGPNIEATGIDCFKYYRFGSVVFLYPHAEKKVYAPGETVRINTTILNTNPYPIVHGNVIAQVLYENVESGNKQGFYILDEFSAFEELALDGNASYELAVEWRIPETAPAGKYYIALYFQEMHKYNLAGLPFLNHVYGALAEFEVKSGIEKQPFYIDRNSVYINGEHQILRSFINEFDQNEEITIKFDLINTQNKKSTIFMQYSLYSWDQSDEANKIDALSKGEILELEPSEKHTVELKFKDLEAGAYQLVIKGYADGWQNILMLRFAIRGAKGRFIFSGLTKFPVLKGESFGMFACFSNTTGWFDTFEGRVLLELYDKEGKLIESYSYNGTITSKIIAIKKDINASESYDELKLVATITDAKGNIHQKVEKIYRLSDFRDKNVIKRFEEQKETPPSKTPPKPETPEETPPKTPEESETPVKTPVETPKPETNNIMFYAIVAIVVIIILAAFWYLKIKEGE